MTFDDHEIDKLMTWARSQTLYAIEHGVPKNRPVRLEIAAIEHVGSRLKGTDYQGNALGYEVIHYIRARAYLAEPRCQHKQFAYEFHLQDVCECGPLAEQRIG
jgi:hypothetical protein